MPKEMRSGRAILTETVELRRYPSIFPTTTPP